jgi:hypothetical protein
MDRAELFSFSNGDRYEGKTVEEVFSDIKNNNIWLENESVSGAGSTIIQTTKIREEIPLILDQLKIKTVFDIPCGDFNWFREIDLSNNIYLGGDIVPDIIRRNNEKYSAENIRFIHFNLLEDVFTQKDLVFCRDCLVHFSLNDIFKALKNIKSSGSKYLMTTTFPEETGNKDIVTGGWRPLNFQLAPFDFPEPEILLNENCTEANGVFKDKSLAVWEIDKLNI